MADGEGLKEAFCVLLWVTNGGNLDTKGRPIYRSAATIERFDDMDLGLDSGGAEEYRAPKKYVRGFCTRPYDCYSCPLLQEEINRHPQDEAFWICPMCVTSAVRLSKERGLPFHLPGHFTEGLCQYRGCTRPARVEDGIEIPPHHSRFLQLFIGPINK